MTPQARDRLSPFFREAILDAKKIRPFPHQAAFWAALDGMHLTDTVTDSFPCGVYNSLPDLAPYYEARSPIPHDATDVFTWSGDIENPGYKIERRLLEHAVFPARFCADLAAYKAGKSLQSGVYVAAELLVPNTMWDIVGMEYTICEPEFRYIADLLLGTDGLNLPVKGRDEFDWKNYPSVYCRTYQDSVGVGRMKIELSNGSVIEAKSWQSSEGLKGKERDGYLWAESYQFRGIKAFASLKQNLRARNGKSIFATTPDDPWVDILRELGDSPLKQHRQWFCIGNVARIQNPYTYSEDEMEADRDILTREQHAISWEGKLGTYVGSVFQYTRGQRIATPQTHPELWLDSEGPAVPGNFRIPYGYRVIAGADTGTYSAASWAMFSDDKPSVCFFIGEVTNYRYIATQIEQDESYSMLRFYEDIRKMADTFDARYALYADPNSQFKHDAWANGIRLLKGSAKPEQRTERLRALFQHDRVFFMPWMKILPYEAEIAKYPPEETSTGKWQRLKDRDHCLDTAEHIAAIDPHGLPSQKLKPRLAIESLLDVKIKMPKQIGPWG